MDNIRPNPYPTDQSYIRKQFPNGGNWYEVSLAKDDWDSRGMVTMWVSQNECGKLYRHRAVLRGDGRLLSEVDSYVVSADCAGSYRGSLVGGQFRGVDVFGYRYV